MTQSNLDLSQVERIIDTALREDVGSGDITTNLLFLENAASSAYMMAKGNGIVAGLPVAEMVFRKLDKNFFWKPKNKDGDVVKPKDIIVEMEGTTRAVLTGERLALNILQRLSGIATLTSQFVKAVKGLNTKILDTRKTVPGIRALDKYAVAVGGGQNHRVGLYDGVLIKDNHIKLAGGITNAVNLIRKKDKTESRIEVETSTLEEVREALSLNVDVIMLDNMSIDTILEALEIINGKALTEASGGITLENVRKVAETGVNFISIGALTHSVQALDIGMYIP